MQKLLHIHLNFLCRSKRFNSYGESPIVLRIIYRGERKDIYTGLYCNKKEWDPIRGRLLPVSKRNTSCNENLDLIYYRAIQVFEQLKYKGLPFTMDELVSVLKGKDEKPMLLAEYLQQRIIEINERSQIDISKKTVEKYLRVIRFVIDFLTSTHANKKILLANLDAHFTHDFFHYLRTHRKIGNNSAIKYIGVFRTVLTPAIDDGVIQVNPFKGLKLKFKKVYKDYLTNEELSSIMIVELNNEHLRRIRDQFLFCCFTGLAYIDLKQFSRVHIKKDTDGSYFIEKCRQKTGQKSIIPLIAPAIHILKNYSISDDFRNFNWYVSSNQKVNEGLKRIGTFAKIEKGLHFHLARHTFATTITLSNGIPIESVSSMLGHSSLRQTQHYAKVVSLKLKNEMKNVDKIYSIDF
jgi:site-specific recombinase XerD